MPSIFIVISMNYLFPHEKHNGGIQNNQNATGYEYLDGYL